MFHKAKRPDWAKDSYVEWIRGKWFEPHPWRRVSHTSIVLPYDILWAESINLCIFVQPDGEIVGRTIGYFRSHGPSGTKLPEDIKLSRHPKNDENPYNWYRTPYIANSLSEQDSSKQAGWDLERASFKIRLDGLYEWKAAASDLLPGPMKRSLSSPHFSKPLPLP